MTNQTSSLTPKVPVRVLCLGDIVGRPGRVAVKLKLKEIVQQRGVDLVVANGENVAGGVGIDPDSADELCSAGVNVITLGDHAWSKREIRDYLALENSAVIRPANYPTGAPGRGWIVRTLPSGLKVGVFNLLGRVFMNFALDCPFRKADQLLQTELRECDVVIGDMHAEATSEKVALGRYLDGRISLLVGTHTHVPTADEQILPGGTGYITDLGMCGPRSGVIGMDFETAVGRLISGLPCSYKVARGGAILSGVVATLSGDRRAATSIERVSVSVDL